MVPAEEEWITWETNPKRELLFAISSTLRLSSWIFLPILRVAAGLRRQRALQHADGAGAALGGEPGSSPPSMARKRSRMSSASYMASLSSLTHRSTPGSWMRLRSASARMLLRSASVVSSLAIAPGTPRSVSTSSFAIPTRTFASLAANASSAAAM
ncbi:Os03g0689688, partial [Oryza sativa Japonica Group]